MRTRNIDKQELVKQKAIEMIVTDGLEGFSINKLAKACGISVATLYIYYKDRDDLILSIALEEAKRMGEVLMEGFDPGLSFTEGLRQQWKNRARHMLENQGSVKFFEQLRTSTYLEKIHSTFEAAFREPLGKFMHNVIERGEIKEMPFEVYWSIAFAPLYNLIKFNTEGKSMGNRPFELTDDILWQTFDLVVKALKN